MADRTWQMIEALSIPRKQEKALQFDLDSIRELVFRLSYALTLDYTQAEDLAQDCLIKIWQHRGRLEELECPEAWIAKVVTNKARNYWRRTRKWLPLQESVPAPSEQDPTIVELRQEIGNLSEDLRNVVLLVGVYGYSYSETGQVLQIPEGTVASRLNTAKRELQRRLGE